MRHHRWDSAGQFRLSSSPGGLLPRGPHQNRTRRFPPSGSSADVAHGDAPQIRTRIRGTGRGYRSNNATNLGQGSTTFRISGDMSPDVNAPVMGPFESAHQHGPPLLGRVRGPTRSPTSSLVCSPPTPSLPSAAAPVVPGRWPTLSLCDKEEEGPPRCLGRPLPACRRLRPRWVRVSACPSRRDRHRLQAAQCPGHVGDNRKFPICGNRKPHTLVVGGVCPAFHAVDDVNSEGAGGRCTDGRRGCC